MTHICDTPDLQTCSLTASEAYKNCVSILIYFSEAPEALKDPERKVCVCVRERDLLAELR